MNKLTFKIWWYDGTAWQSKESEVPLNEVHSISACVSHYSHDENWFILTTKKLSTMYISDFSVVKEV